MNKLNKIILRHEYDPSITDGTVQLDANFTTISDALGMLAVLSNIIVRNFAYSQEWNDKDTDAFLNILSHIPFGKLMDAFEETFINSSETDDGLDTTMLQQLVNRTYHIMQMADDFIDSTADDGVAIH